MASTDLDILAIGEILRDVKVLGDTRYVLLKPAKSNGSAYIIWRLFNVQNVLEVGRSSGYLLEAINDLGYTAIGLTTPFDVLAQGPLEKSHGVALPRDFGFGGGSFDLVVLLDTLEHLAPAVIPTVLAELQRSCDGFIYVTISSFGLDDVGDDGWFVGKVKE